ncbi:hypothetical protein [Pseudorhodobacter antarcticus]|uniref:hypothetical protein n=1 Tax=Pseudorhodobacter antarcticus TaxID=1077947 RepID=UPI00067C59C9|nr:hypothetical protein [Pseudorhodobacter antarcticus]
MKSKITKKPDQNPTYKGKERGPATPNADDPDFESKRHLGSKTSFQAMKHWLKLEPEPFDKTALSASGM